MNCISVRKILVFSLILVFSAAVSEAQSFDRPSSPKQHKSVSKKPAGKKKDKIFGSRSVKRIQKKQDAKDKKLKKDYEDFVKANKKRSIEIQTPAVKERMKQNVKDADSKYKAKKKKAASSTKKARQKYR